MEDPSDHESMEVEEEVSEMESGGNDSDDPEHYNVTDEDKSWLQWFCNLEGNEFFTEIDVDWLSSSTSLVGLTGLFPDYKSVLNQEIY